MTYDEIVVAAKAYADRNDVEVANNMDTFIILAETRMNRLLKTRKQSTRTYTPTVDDQEFYSFPPDYSAMRNIQLNSELPTQDHKSEPFTMLTPVLFDVQRNLPYSGKNYYSVIGNQIQIFPIQAAGASIEITYYQKVPNLNSIDKTNWVSEDQPDLYVAGIAGEISLFAKDYDTADSWFQRMGSAINDLDISDEEERWSGAPLVMRVG